MVVVVAVILKQNENKLQKNDIVIMLEVFYRTCLKPDPLSLLLSREQTQIQLVVGFY